MKKQVRQLAQQWRNKSEKTWAKARFKTCSMSVMVAKKKKSFHRHSVYTVGGQRCSRCINTLLFSPIWDSSVEHHMPWAISHKIPVRWARLRVCDGLKVIRWTSMLEVRIWTQGFQVPTPTLYPLCHAGTQMIKDLLVSDPHEEDIVSIELLSDLLWPFCFVVCTWNLLYPYWQTSVLAEPR